MFQLTVTNSKTSLGFKIFNSFEEVNKEIRISCRIKNISTGFYFNTCKYATIIDNINIDCIILYNKQDI